MKLQIMSDIHLEFNPDKLPEISSDADVLVFAGDLSSSQNQVKKFFEGIREHTKAPIVYVLGNHEFYGKFLTEVSLYKEAVAHIPDVHILDKDVFVYEDVRFIGCTLWTDFDSRRCELDAYYGMNDFRHIKTFSEDFKVKNIDTSDILQEHTYCRNFLNNALKIARDFLKQKTVVVSHHGPSFYCVSDEYKNHKLNGAFFVELSNLILDENPDLWVYGHTHYHNESKLGSTNIVCNPFGYPFEKESSGYIENFIVEV